MTCPDDGSDENALLTYAQCAKRLNVKVSTLRRWVRDLNVPHMRVGHQFVRFHYPTVFKFLESRKRS